MQVELEKQAHTGNTPQSDTHSRREALLHVAIDLIWNATYDSVGVNDISTKAGVTKGSFYHYFRSKAELFDSASELFWQRVKPLLDAIVSAEKTGLEQMCELARYSCRMQRHYSATGNPVAGCPFLSTAAQIGHREPLVANAGQRMSERQIHYMEIVITNLIREGFAESDLPPRQLARLCHQFYQGIMQYGRTFQSRQQVEEDIGCGFARLIGLKEQYMQQFCDAHRVELLQQ